LGRKNLENGSKSASEKRRVAMQEKERERESKSWMDEEKALKGNGE